MKYLHCDFCGDMMKNREGTEGVFKPDGLDKILKFRVSIANKEEYDPKRGLRYKNTDCCLDCLKEFVAELVKNGK